MEFTVVIDLVTLTATIIIGAFIYFSTSAIIRFPTHVFYGGMIIAGSLIVSGVASLYYGIAWANPSPLFIGLAKFIAILGKGNPVAPLFGGCVAFTIAVLTGMYKRAQDRLT